MCVLWCVRVCVCECVSVCVSECPWPTSPDPCRLCRPPAARPRRRAPPPARAPGRARAPAARLPLPAATVANELVVAAPAPSCARPRRRVAAVSVVLADGSPSSRSAPARPPAPARRTLPPAPAAVVALALPPPPRPPLAGSRSSGAPVVAPGCLATLLLLLVARRAWPGRATALAGCRRRGRDDELINEMVMR